MWRTAEMKTHRRILELLLIDKQRSEDIREKCGIPVIDDWIKCRRENWYSVHVERPNSQENFNEQASRKIKQRLT